MKTLVALLLCFFPLAHAESSEPEREVRQLVERFVRSVNEADIESFVACFAADATAFFPSLANPYRKVGTTQIREAITPTFKLGPPAARVEPRDLTVRVIDRTAFVTFEAGSPSAVARRTLVLNLGEHGWKIVHLHASNLATR